MAASTTGVTVPFFCRLHFSRREKWRRARSWRGTTGVCFLQHMGLLSLLPARAGPSSVEENDEHPVFNRMKEWKVSIWWLRRGGIHVLHFLTCTVPPDSICTKVLCSTLQSCKECPQYCVVQFCKLWSTFTGHFSVVKYVWRLHCCKDNCLY